MAFFWTTDLGDLFFPGLNVKGVVPLVLACLVVGMLSIVYEGIKVIYSLKLGWSFQWLRLHFICVGAHSKCTRPCGTRANRSGFMCPKWNGQFTCNRSEFHTNNIYEEILQTVQRSDRFPVPQFNWLHCHVELHGVQWLVIFGRRIEHGNRLFHIWTYFDEN